MSRAASAKRIAGLVLGFTAVASCGGEKIRLGDAVAGSGAITAAGEGGELFGNAGGSLATGGAGGNQAGSGGAAGAPCQGARVKGSEVVWLGDTWVTIPGIQHTRVEELARAAGALGADEQYVVLAAPYAGIDAVTNQYKTQQAGPTKVKVVIMDGGTWDTIGTNGSDASVAMVVTGFKQLLATIAQDGTVTHVIYYLLPELKTIPGVVALRGPLTQACNESAVPCHFLDLGPEWMAHTDYTSNDGIQASTLGATYIANSIWKIMEDNCVTIP